MGYPEKLPHVARKREKSRRGLEKVVEKVDKRYLGLGFLLYSLIVFTLWWFGINSWRSAKLYLTASLPLKPHCSDVIPISSEEFITRQATLADTLRDLKASAFIVEPGATAKYYFNVSSSDWHLSERPLLFVLTPGANSSDSKVSVLTPTFEESRAKLLVVPHSQGLNYVSWNEEANPYQPVFESIVSSSDEAAIYVDGSMRTFVADGLQKAVKGGHVGIAPREIAVLREKKSKAELYLMKCANEATVLAIRHVHKKLYVGIHESEASAMMSKALTDVGLKDGGCLTLFGENAALPHGSGSDRLLAKNEFALFDCTASLEGYWSDVTRTVSLGHSISEEQMKIWFHVRTAQLMALHVAAEGVIAKDVDNAAREWLKVLGYGPYFTHRLGHGIGLEVHEGPYLNGGNEDVLEQGHTFSDEPGIYIEGKIGVRLEDCFYIAEDGKAALLTEGVGGMASYPWDP